MSMKCNGFKGRSSMRILSTLLMLIAHGCNCYAQLPPTTLKGQRDSTAPTTFNYQVPFNQSTRTSGTNALVETGNNNLLVNPGFESTTFSTGWTASGDTFDGTLPPIIGALYGLKTARIEFFSGANVTLTSQAVAVPPALYAGNGEASCTFLNQFSNTGVYVLEAYNGTSVIGSISIEKNSTSIPTRTTLNFIMPLTGNIQMRVRSTAVGSIMYIDDCYLGAARNLNTATQMGSWTQYTPTLTNLPLSSSSLFYQVDGPNINITGTITLSGTGSAGEARVGLPTGYTVSSGAAPTIRDVGRSISNSTTFSSPGWQGVILASGGNGYVTFGRDTTSTNGFTSLQGNDASFGALTYSVWAKVPVEGLAGNVSFTPATSSFVWSGYHDNTCVWSRSSTSYGDFGTDASCALVEQQNSNAGTVTTVAGTLPGIVFTPTTTGLYEVCASTPMYGSNAANHFLRLYDNTSSVVISELADSTGVTLFAPYTLCGEVSVSSVGSTRDIRLQGATPAGSITIGVSGASGNVNQGSVYWTVKRVTQNVPAPVLVGSVTTSGTTTERIERAIVTNNGSTCSVTTQSGAWITSISRSGAGVCDITFASGNFSASPSCVGVDSGGMGGAATVQFVSTTATSTTSATKSGGTLTDGTFMMICMGPR